MNETKEFAISAIRTILKGIRNGEICVDRVEQEEHMREQYDSHEGFLAKIPTGRFDFIIKFHKNNVDRSEEADAKRLRWLLDGNGYFMEENYLCGHDSSEKAKDLARIKIDEAMKR